MSRRLERLEWLAERGQLPLELATLAGDPDGRLVLLLPEARAAAIRSLAANGPGTITLTRHACIRLRRDAGGRGENALIRSLPFGRVPLLPWSDGRDPFRRGESLAHVLVWQTDSQWWTPYVGALVISKGTELRVMRTKPDLELWAPDLPPIGRRWRKL